MTLPSSQRLGKLLLVGISTVLTLGVAEVGMRLFGPPPPPPEDTLRTYTEYDPDLGWRGRPNAKGRYTSSRFSIAVALNSGGWRDDEPTAARGPDQIVVLGDSFAWGYGVEKDDTFASRLERALPGWRVQNYGVCGYGTDQELLVLRRSALAIHPRIVVLEFAIGNDLDNISSARSYNLPKPRFVLSEGHLRLENVPVPATPNWNRAARTGVRDFLTAHLRVYAWAREHWPGLRPGVDRLLRLVRDSAAEGVRVRMYAREPGERVGKSWALAEALLQEVRDDAAREGARLAVLVVPDRPQVEDELWGRVAKEYGLDASAYDRDLPDRRIREIGDRLGILIVDPLEDLRAEARKGRSLFVPDDPHWNRDGHAVAAEALRRGLAPWTGAAGIP